VGFLPEVAICCPLTIARPPPLFYASQTEGHVVGSISYGIAQSSIRRRDQIRGRCALPRRDFVATTAAIELQISLVLGSPPRGARSGNVEGLSFGSDQGSRRRDAEHEHLRGPESRHDIPQYRYLSCTRSVWGKRNPVSRRSNDP